MIWWEGFLGFNMISGQEKTLSKAFLQPSTGWLSEFLALKHPFGGIYWTPRWQVDQYPVGRSCQGQVGYWSPVCAGPNICNRIENSEHANVPGTCNNFTENQSWRMSGRKHKCKGWEGALLYILPSLLKTSSLVMGKATTLGMHVTFQWALELLGGSWQSGKNLSGAIWIH